MGTSLKDKVLCYGSGFLCAAAATLLAGTPARAQVLGEDPLAGVNIVKIEEDWVLDVADPEPAGNLPQIETVFGPSDPSSGTYAIFQLNHGTLPQFGEGGMQLQCWWGGYLVGYKTQFAPTELSVAIEEIKYTTKIRLDNGNMHLYLRDGHSLTWGDFAQNGWDPSSNLHITLSTSRTNLNDWNSQMSIKNSRVTYGGNRVNKFMRTEVRYYTSANIDATPYYTDSTDAVVHLLAEDAYAPPPVNQ